MVKVVINTVFPVSGVFCQSDPLFKRGLGLGHGQQAVFQQYLGYYFGKVIVTCELGAPIFLLLFIQATKNFVG
jgi:hypothetical protein